MAPLDGLRIIDLTRVVAGPFCTMMLGDMGAEVLKIEEPKHGDDSRAWAPLMAGTGSFFLALNRSKKSVALDLKTAEGADALRRLIETADVLIENFRPGSLAELGFDYATVAAMNPRLIYCSISGYGQTGPVVAAARLRRRAAGRGRHHGHDRVSGRRADARRRRDHRLPRRAVRDAGDPAGAARPAHAAGSDSTSTSRCSKRCSR